MSSSRQFAIMSLHGGQKYYHEVCVNYLSHSAISSIVSGKGSRGNLRMFRNNNNKKKYPGGWRQLQLFFPPTEQAVLLHRYPSDLGNWISATPSGVFQSFRGVVCTTVSRSGGSRPCVLGRLNPTPCSH